MALVDRETHLQALNTVWQAAADKGCMVSVYGEAGIGKTALVEQFVSRHEGGSRLLWGACDALFTPRPLGPLHDIAAQTEGKLLSLLQAGNNQTVIFSACLQELQTQPTMAVIEDIHWADEATLDLLKYLGRRIHLTLSLLVVTYRNDELGLHHPLRLLLGDLATSPAWHSLALTGLTLAGIRTLIGDRELDAERLHRQTGGNPFFVTEVIAAESEGVPVTIRDAVLARVARLSLSGRAVLNAAAVIGGRIEPWQLAEVTRAEISAVDESLALGILRAQSETFAFRHELVRQAILDTILPHQRVFLHQAVLDSLKLSPQPDTARLVHHAEAAGNRDAVLEYAPKAAQEAVKVNAHREAAALYALALRFGSCLPPETYARLLEAYARECEIIDQQLDAIAALEEATAIWRDLDRPLEQGQNLARVVSMFIRSGQQERAQQAGREALELLQTLPPGPELAFAYRIQATLYLVNRDCREALALAQKALEMAEQFQDAEVLAATRYTIGTAWLFLDCERGCTVLEQSLAFAQEADLVSWVAHSYTNLGSGLGELYQYARAQQYLTAGIAYAAEYDLDRSRLYMSAWQALTCLYLGRWSEAEETAVSVLNHAVVNTKTRIRALLAQGLLCARRGQPQAASLLDEALALACRNDNIQCLGLVQAARLEAAWLTGTLEARLPEAQAIYQLTVSKQHPSLAAALAYWHRQAGEEVATYSWMLSPFVWEIKGRWREAAAGWEALGCPYEQARALTAGDSEAQLAALSIFEQLAARPMIERVKQQLSAAGVPTIPRGPRTSTKENPFQLTNRQLEVLQLLTENLTDAQIADRLHISPKTVGHHVSAVLAKLNVSGREEAARKVENKKFLEKSG